MEWGMLSDNDFGGDRFHWGDAWPKLKESESEPHKY